MTLLATPLHRRTGSAPRIELGPESGDHLSLRVLSRLHPRSLDQTEAGWLVCPVHVHVGGFSGDVAVVLGVEELCRFGEALSEVRAGVRRTAVLESAAGWIDLTVTREPDETLTATGHLSDEPGTGSGLRFRIAGLDTTSLDHWVGACSDAVAEYPLPAA